MKTSKIQLVLGLALAAFTFNLAVGAQAQTLTELGVFNSTNGDAPWGDGIEQRDVQRGGGGVYGGIRYVYQGDGSKGRDYGHGVCGHAIGDVG